MSEQILNIAVEDLAPQPVHVEGVPKPEEPSTSKRGKAPPTAISDKRDRRTTLFACALSKHLLGTQNAL
jgi:hypothetical protein